MCRGNKLVAYGLPLALKEVVAQFACGLFDGKLVVERILLGIELCHIARHTVALGQTAHKGLVAVAVAWSQMEIAMGDGEGNMGVGDKMA